MKPFLLLSLTALLYSCSGDTISIDDMYDAVKASVKEKSGHIAVFPELPSDYTYSGKDSDLHGYMPTNVPEGAENYITFVSASANAPWSVNGRYKIVVPESQGSMRDASYTVLLKQGDGGKWLATFVSVKE